MKVLFFLMFWNFSFGWIVSAHATGLSAVTNGVYLGVSGKRNDSGVFTNEPIPFDAKLVIQTFCNTGKVELLRPLDPAFGMKVRLWDANGKVVQKTELGNRYGANFDHLRNVSESRLGICMAWGSFQKNPELGGGEILQSPKDLFKIEHPGIYVLELEMQMFRRYDSGAASPSLFRFSPVRIKIEKPEN